MLGKKLIQAASGNAAGSGLGIEDVFSTWLYTGNGGTQTITNGIDLAGEGGLVWVKERNASDRGHALLDTARGINQTLVSNTANQQYTFPASLSFQSAGFNLGSDPFGYVNNSSKIYASWTFRKAPGFFDVVTYTGNGTTQNIAHNLGSVPGAIIVKRTDSTSGWLVYHRSLSTIHNYLLLNSTATVGGASVVSPWPWGATAPTNSQFSVGFNSDVSAEFQTNANGASYVAYIFAHDEQIFGEGGDQSVIKCGSYTGNGAATGPFIDLGWEPQWILIKNASSTGNWVMIDSMRGFLRDGNSAWFKADLADAEAFQDYVSIGSTGFNPTFNYTNVNTSGSQYIYIAIRRGPMKTPTSGAEVFKATTYTADNTTNRIISGIGFPPDLLIGQRRDATGFNVPAWYDKMRGSLRYLYSSGTAAEVTIGSGKEGELGQNSFVADGTAGLLNFPSPATFVGWTFRRAPGFFDVVAYTGDGAVGRQIPHNLGVRPEFMIIKGRNVSSAWSCQILTGPQTIVFGDSASPFGFDRDSAAITYTNPFVETIFTSSIFSPASIAGAGLTNGGGGTYIAYLFATCPGVSKVGSYTGTGTTLNIDCGFTAGARFVLIKRTDSTGSWFVWDTARGIVSGNDPYLLLNSTAAEVTSTDYIDPLSSGFQISSTAPAAINASGGSYIYLAIA